MKTLFITSTDGTRIAYDVTGDGPPLMLLHGAGKTRYDWHKVGYVERSLYTTCGRCGASHPDHVAR